MQFYEMLPVSIINTIILYIKRTIPSRKGNPVILVVKRRSQEDCLELEPFPAYILIIRPARATYSGIISNKETTN